MPRYFHTTDYADAIVRGGFRDGTGSYLFAELTLTGVFVADCPVDCNEGAQGDQVLIVEVPDAVDLGEFEIVEDGKPYREWCIPAALLNRHATVSLLAEERHISDSPTSEAPTVGESG
jgi:hypothetical protein